jgi:hypothetical protein
MNQTPTNIQIKYGDQVVTLPTVTDTATVYGDVRIFMRVRGAEALPVARVPDGSTSPIHRPHVIACDWGAR